MNLPQRWPRLAIIILNWKRWRDTIHCLEAVECLDYPDYEVAVVNNASGDDSVGRICGWAQDRFETTEAWSEYDPAASLYAANGAAKVAVARCLVKTTSFSEPRRLHLLAVNQNLGFTGGNNVAVNFLLADPAVRYVFLLNNDATVTPGVLKACVAKAREADAAVVGARVREGVAADEPAAKSAPKPGAVGRAIRDCLLVGARPLWLSDTHWPSVYVSGCALLIRSDLLGERRACCGYYLNPRLFLYYEEADLCAWAVRHGYRIALAAGAIVDHALSASSGRGSALSHYYSTRNRVFIARSFFSRFSRLFFHLQYPASRCLRALQRRAQGRPDLSAAIMQGLIDGYRNVAGKWAGHAD